MTENQNPTANLDALLDQLDESLAEMTAAIEAEADEGRRLVALDKAIELAKTSILIGKEAVDIDVILYCARAISDFLECGDIPSDGGPVFREDEATH